MTKKEFLNKHNLTELDWRNLIRFERVRLSGLYNMNEYLGLMSELNTNGGKRLALWIQQHDNYYEFLDTLDGER